MNSKNDISIENYRFDQTETRKVGGTTFIVSSFLRADKAPAFLDILSDLLKQELQHKPP